jgi:hypothetical protein
VLDELEKAGLVTLADKGYQGTTWAKVPYKDKNKPEPQKEANRAHAKLRAPASRQTRSSRRGTSSTSSAAAPGEPGKSPRPSTYCYFTPHNQVGNGSVRCSTVPGQASIRMFIRKGTGSSAEKANLFT